MKKILAMLLIGGSVSAFAGNAYIDADVGVNTSWSELGLGVDAGYMFNKYVGLEGGFTYSPGSSYNYGWGSYSSNYYMLDGAVKGVLPLTEQFSLFGKLGIAFNNYTTTYTCNNGNPGCGNGWDGSWTGSNTGVLFGGGAQFNLSRQWSLHVEDYTSTGDNPNFFMFGGQYNF